MISTPDLERRLQALATDIDWPDPVDVAARLQLPERRRTAWLRPSLPRPSLPRPSLRLAVAGIAVLIVAFTTVLIASPATRSAVARLLGFPGITVEVPPEDAPTSLPTAAGLDLGTPMGLAEAQEQVGFPLRTLPLAGEQVWFDAGTEAVHIAYAAASRPVLLTQLKGDADLDFVKQSETVTPTEVDGQFALWAADPNHALLRTRDGTTLQAKLSDNALLWSQDRVTYRLEIDADLETAVQLAERLR